LLSFTTSVKPAPAAVLENVHFPIRAAADQRNIRDIGNQPDLGTRRKGDHRGLLFISPISACGRAGVTAPLSFKEPPADALHSTVLRCRHFSAHSEVRHQ